MLTYIHTFQGFYKATFVAKDPKNEAKPVATGELSGCPYIIIAQKTVVLHIFSMSGPPPVPDRLR